MQEEQHIIGFDYQRRYDGNCGQRSLMHPRRETVSRLVLTSCS